MSKLLIIAIVIIFVSLGFSVYSGILLVRNVSDEIKLEFPEIPPLMSKNNPDSDQNKNDDVIYPKIEKKTTGFSNFSSNPNWILKEHKVGVNAHEITEFQDGDFRSYSNVENNMQILLWMYMLSTQEDALEYFKKGKQNILQNLEKPSIYDLIEYDEVDLSPIHAENCYGYKRQYWNGQDTSMFTMHCQRQNFTYLIHFILPVGTDVSKNDIIEFTNQIFGTEHFVQQ